MPTYRKDYIERMIEQLADALAAIVKARKEQKHEQSLALIRDASLSVLGMDYSALTMVDAASSAELLGHSQKVKALAKLVTEEAEVIAARGEPLRSTGKLEHALALLYEAQKLQKGPDPDCEEQIRALEERLHGGA